jgi:exonuclease VII large subunit
VIKRLEIANRRLAELRVLAKKRPDIAEKLSKRYKQQVELLEGEIQKVKKSERERLIKHVGEVTLKHQEVLLDVYQKVPEEAKKGIENALEESLRGHQKAIKMLKGDEKEKVIKKLEKRRERVLHRLETVEPRVEEQSEVKERFEKMRKELDDNSRMMRFEKKLDIVPTVTLPRPKVKVTAAPTLAPVDREKESNLILPKKSTNIKNIKLQEH